MKAKLIIKSVKKLDRDLLEENSKKVELLESGEESLYLEGFKRIEGLAVYLSGERESINKTIRSIEKKYGREQVFVC